MSKYANFYTEAFMMQRIRSDINAHKRFSDTNELLRKLTVNGMEDVVPLFYAVTRSYKVKFPEELEQNEA